MRASDEPTTARRHQHVFGCSSSGDWAVDKMDLRFAIAIQCVQLNRRASPGVESQGRGNATIADGWSALVANRDARAGLTLFPFCRLGARAQIGPLKPKITGQTV